MAKIPELDRVPGPAELYIGGMFSMRRKEALKKANITHVVSALRLALDDDLFRGYQQKIIDVDDVEYEDILQHFATSNAFIHQGLDAGGGVLVHCAMGKSRSSTLVIAYMLSQDPTLEPSSALTALRTARPMAEPNPGFMEQLQMYNEMGCPSDVESHPIYQRWLYKRAVDESVACGQAPDRIRFEDEVTPQPPDSQSLEVRCRKCRRALATDQYTVEHTPKSQPGRHPAFAGPIDTVASSSPIPSSCAHLFLEPLSWMRPELEQGKMDGRLECPNEKCRALVGKYTWLGMRCSCGQWVTPALSLTRNRVDEIRKRPMAQPVLGQARSRDGKM